MNRYSQKQVMLEIRASSSYWGISEGKTFKVWWKYNPVTCVYQKHREDAPAEISHTYKTWYERGLPLYTEKQPPDLDW